MRDKNISVRVNSNKLKEFNKIVEANTRVEEYYSHKIYTCSLNKESWLSNKYSIADLLEEALDKFIKKHRT